ncbi:MAG: ferritin family protein [Candidatus Hadarchaeales archaeon]
MLSELPTEVKKLRKEELDREILRAGMIAELDAINFYEQMAAMANSELVRKLLLDIAREEKTHLGEFQALLLEKDREQVGELEKGKKEVEELKSSKR